MGASCSTGSIDIDKADMYRFQRAVIILFIFIAVIIILTTHIFPLVNHGTECQQARNKEEAKKEFITVGSLSLFFIAFGLLFIIAFKDQIFNSENVCGENQGPGTEAFFKILGAMFIVSVIVLLIFSAVNISTGVNKCNPEPVRN